MVCCDLARAVKAITLVALTARFREAYNNMQVMRNQEFRTAR